VVVGEVYMVDTSILNGRDPKPCRPVVVVSVPDNGADLRVWVVARTSDLRQQGVPHPADSRLRLDRPGVFADAYVRWGHLDDFTDGRRARLCGKLDQRTLERVLGRWAGIDQL